MKFLSLILFVASSAFGSAMIQDGSVTPQKLADRTSTGNWILNCGLSSSVSSNALTISLKTQAGGTPSTTSPCKVFFRSATAVTGTYSPVSTSSGITVVVPSGATLGQVNGVLDYIYVYLINNAGTAELAVSSVVYGEGSLVSTTVLDTASDLRNVMYSTTARSNVAVRLIGRIGITEATAGTWATGATETSLVPFQTGGVWQVKKLTANVTVDTTGISDLGFSNLTVGRTYRVMMKGFFNINASNNAQMIAVHNGTIIANTNADNETAAATGRTTNSETTIFKATATTLTFNFIRGTAGGSLLGDNTFVQTYVVLEELPGYSQTDKW